ncbi:MAG: agmatine deiminase family protein [Candidatus Stygibacter australis]|nr:agmatine deiminase family protein [Candidatus Stygibacter australis]MDP8321705.1 agmatine deiminase family protein [Candidatus Stygibacter australis]
MKKLLLIISLMIAISLFAVEKIDVLENDPFPLTHWLSAAEAARWDEIGRDFYETDPPVGPVHNVAEFETMEGVLIRYPFGIPMGLIIALSEQTKLLTIVSSTSQQNTVLSQYNSQGVNTANCEFLIAPTDSYWTRDYGPWYVIDGNDEFGIVNFPYNRPRPNDNDIPIEVADYLDINLFGMDVIQTGGNYMTDGFSISASTNIAYDENSISNDEVDQRMLDYLGIQTYYVIDDPNNTYIDHIDCWGKFLDVDKVLIREVPASHAQYDEIEAVADFFAGEVSSYGNNYQVYRVNTPNNQPYTNSLILNDHVYVPTVGSQYDDDAIASYEAAMPGYTIVNVPDGGAGWESTDALHCRAKGIADRQMLYIHHLPLLDDQPADVDLNISAELTAYSGAGILEGEVIMHYKIADGEWIDVVMESTDPITWEADIPGQPEGSVVHYYISAMDGDGNTAMHPLIGEPDPHEYYAGGTQAPQLVFSPAEFELVMTSDTTEVRTLELTNGGGGELNYSIEFMETTRDITGSYVSCGNDFFSPGETIELEFTAYNGSEDSEWVKEVYIDFPEGFNVLSATDFVGGSGGDLLFRGPTGNGALCYWMGQTVSGWGLLQEGEYATCTVEIEVAPDFTGNAVLNWTILGDEYGEEPHEISGDIELEIYGGPVNWISADQLSGQLWAQETDEITLTFDTTGLADGDYPCNIVVSWNEAETIIPVMLTVLSMPADENEIAPLITSAVIYPNPFNDNGQRDLITLEFSIAEPVNDFEIAVYNLKGQKVADLYQGEMTQGEHQIYWNGKTINGQSAAAGLYFYKLSSKEFSIYKKAIILK